MTATPIPRTLAMTVYGDLDVSVIDELPPGRKPIETYHFYENKRTQVINFLCRAKGRTTGLYGLSPNLRIGKNGFKNLEDGFRHVTEIFAGIKTGMVHGRMKPAEKEEAMQKFKQEKRGLWLPQRLLKWVWMLPTPQ